MTTKNSGRIGVLISGRGSHLKNLMDSCATGYIPARVVVVISNVAEAKGLLFARDANIETIVLSQKQFTSREAFDRELVNALKQREVDLICLAGFMRLLSSAFVREFPLQIMNVHPALLPSFPGLHAQRQALDHGVKITGCTVHFVDEGLDSGPIILQNAIDVHSEDTEETLSERLLPVEHRTYRDAVRLFFENRLKVDGRRVIIR